MKLTPTISNSAFFRGLTEVRHSLRGGATFKWISLTNDKITAAELGVGAPPRLNSRPGS